MGFFTPEGYGNFGVQGGYDGTGGPQGFFSPSYSISMRPLLDGSGWELSYLDPANYNGMENSGGGYTGPIKMKWTPANGWEVTAGPPGTVLGCFNIEINDWDLGLEPDPNFTITDPEGNVVFDSQNFVSGPSSIPSAEDLAWWDTTLQEYYANNPQLPNPYETEASGAVIAQAEELNRGLEFSDGQWVPVQ